jgi:chromosome segregation protein
MVRAFANDAPPAKLAFYSPPVASAPAAAPAQARLAAWLRLNDAGQQALLADWLHGCWTAAQPGRGAGARGQLQAGRSHLRAQRPRGHRAQRELLRARQRAGRPAGARPGNREPGQAAAAQVLIAEQARTALVRAEAAYADASQRLVSARREGAERSRAHELQVETLRLTQLAEQTRARSEQIAADLAEVDAQLEACRSAA